MPSSSPARPAVAARGRPRSESARRAVLDAAGQLFEKDGYRATTIDAIAARSGVAKTTIYRWWTNRAVLVVELLLRMAARAAPPATIGKDPVRGLRDEMHRVADAAGGVVGRMLLALLAESQNDAEVREALRQGLFTPRRSATAHVIRAAQASGQLRADVPPPIVGDLLFGPIFYRKFIRLEPVTDAFVRQIFAAAMDGLARGPRESARRRGGSSAPRRKTRPTPRA